MLWLFGGRLVNFSHFGLKCQGKYGNPDFLSYIRQTLLKYGHIKSSILCKDHAYPESRF
jgi:hypothetical protein